MESRSVQSFGCLCKNLPRVYKPQARPWIQIENATIQELIDQVAKCPSGDLSIKKQ
ncbi:(4Fe-4S)-binding protein [uncultured Sunxiuqinia sp.]|uniref:(4Fe-4S)-binding protein n=1 Tax=uncultured Sunxiuqinia sp. TaxID=1573825 RepID=UPI002AA6AD4B|nr:(4Fe-4S)-binding protein [uncultured Sunxiuqinia sp.]